MNDAVQTRAADEQHAAQAFRLLAALKPLGIAALATALALGTRWAIDPWLGDRHEFLPVYVAAAAATWLAGWRMGTTVAVLYLLGCEGFLGAPRSAADAEPLHGVLAVLSYALMNALVIAAVQLAASAHRRLQGRVRALDEADHRKSDFMALLAHELRNPLSVLSADTALIRQGKLDPGSLDGAWRALERQTTHMKRIVNDMLDTARIEQGKLAIEPDDVHVATLVTQAIGDAEVAAAAKRQRLVLAIAGDPGCARVDAHRIRQVLDNLLHNASKFSPERSAIRVAVSATPRQVCISVRDKGVGIAPQDLHSIFDPFVQAGPGASRAQGLGLGLALCRSLVEMHGGSIEAHSAGPGCGSEFVVRLPRPPELASCAEVADAESAGPPENPKEPAPASAPDAAAVPAGAPAGPQAAAPGKVLVVDDNSDAADSLAMLLQVLGQEAVVAYTGQAALRVANAEQPRIVFLDLRLPDMSSAAVAAQLRAAAGGVRPAVVGMSGLPPEHSDAPPDLAGFMLKPFDVAAVQGALAAASRVLAGKDAAAVAEPPAARAMRRAG